MHQQSKTNSAKNPPQHIEPQAPAQILNHSTSQGRGHSPSLWLSPLQLQVHALLLYLDDTTIIFHHAEGTRARHLLPHRRPQEKNDTAADELQKQVDLEKKTREDKKKKPAEEKKAKEGKKEVGSGEGYNQLSYNLSTQY